MADTATEVTTGSQLGAVTGGTVKLPNDATYRALALWLVNNGAVSCSRTAEGGNVRAYYLPIGWTMVAATREGRVCWGDTPQQNGCYVVADAENRARVFVRNEYDVRTRRHVFLARLLPRFIFHVETIDGVFRAFVTDGGHDNKDTISVPVEFNGNRIWDMQMSESARRDVSNWLKENRPHYKDEGAYWDE